MIEDNFLDTGSFHEIQTVLLGTEIHWHYQDFLGVSTDQTNQF